MKIIAIAALALFVAACGTDRLSEGAGQSRVDVSVSTHEKGKTPYIETVRIVDGKERDLGRVTFEFVDGKPRVSYEGSAVRAFEGQKAAAQMVSDVTRSLADLGIGITPAVVEAVTKAILPVP